MHWGIEESLKGGYHSQYLLGYINFQSLNIPKLPIITKGAMVLSAPSDSHIKPELQLALRWVCKQCEQFNQDFCLHHTEWPWLGASSLRGTYTEVDDHVYSYNLSSSIMWLSAAQRCRRMQTLILNWIMFINMNKSKHKGYLTTEPKTNIWQKGLTTQLKPDKTERICNHSCLLEWKCSLDSTEKPQNERTRCCC